MTTTECKRPVGRPRKAPIAAGVASVVTLEQMMAALSCSRRTLYALTRDDPDFPALFWVAGRHVVDAWNSYVDKLTTRTERPRSLIQEHLRAKAERERAGVCLATNDVRLRRSGPLPSPLPQAGEGTGSQQI